MIVRAAEWFVKGAWAWSGALEKVTAPSPTVHRGSSPNRARIRPSRDRMNTLCYVIDDAELWEADMSLSGKFKMLFGGKIRADEEGSQNDDNGAIDALAREFKGQRWDADKAAWK